MNDNNRQHVFAAACMGILVFGIVITVLGTILPSLIERFDVDKTIAGTALTLMSVGILVGALAFGPIADRYGFKGLMLASAVIVTIGLEGVAFAARYELVLLAVLTVGLGGGIINGASNALVSDISTVSRSADLSTLGIFFGIGAFGVPLVLGFLLDRFSYVTLTAFVAVPVLVAIAYFAVIQFPSPKQPRGFPLSQSAKLARDPAILLFGLMLFLQSGLEITTGGWSSTFFREELGASAGRATLGLSLFWMGMTAARLILGRILTRMKPSIVLIVSIVLSTIASIFVLTAQSVPVAFIGTFMTGAGLAAGFPVVLGYAGDLYPKLSGTAFSLLFVMALTGGSLVPFGAGMLGESFGLRYSLLISPVSLLLMAVILPFALRKMTSYDRTASG